MKRPSAQKHRRLLMELYDKYYKRITYEELSESNGCFYCGGEGSTIDHCPPISWIPAKGLEWFRERRINLLKVRSCPDCNTKVLGDKAIFTLNERAQAVEVALVQRYERQMTLWSEDEIEEMSPMFRKMIRGRQIQAQELLQRARYAQWRSVMWRVDEE